MVRYTWLLLNRLDSAMLAGVRRTGGAFRRVTRFVDWRFLWSLIILIVVLLVASSYVSAVQGNAAKDARIESLVTAGAHERATASHERHQLLDAVRDLQDKNDQQAEALKALLVWLRGRGIYVPADLIPAGSAGSDTVRSESDSERAARTSTVNGRRVDRSHAASSSGGSSGGSGNGGGTGGGGSHGKSGSKSHGGNKGGKSAEHKKAKKSGKSKGGGHGHGKGKK